MDMVEIVANRSHDEETQVGALLIKNDSSAIIATGYNGFVRGAPDEILPCTRPHKYEYILHAEQNLIFNCAKHGINTENTTLICTHTPCKLCMRMLFSCGITQVIAKTLYKDWQEILLMDDLRVDYRFSKETGYYHLTYLVQKANEAHKGKNVRSVADDNESTNRRTGSSTRRKRTSARNDKKPSRRNSASPRKDKQHK